MTFKVGLGLNRKTIDIFVFCIVLILVIIISNESVGRIPSINEEITNKIYGYSIVNREITSIIEEITDTVAPVMVDEVKEDVENIAPIFNNNIEITERINNYLGESKDNMGFIYYNLISEESISFNEDMFVDAASLYKLGLNIVVYDMVNNGQISLDDIIYYNQGQFQGGTGILQYDTTFNSLPLRTLLEYSIVYSDNIAATMIYDYIGGWVNYKAKLFSILEIDIGSYENITSARIELEVLKYLYKHKDESGYKLLIDDMKNTEFHDRIDRLIPYKEVAHKIGSNDDATHDVGIVFSDEPYVLVFITDGLYNAPDKIAEISKAIYLYNKNLLNKKGYGNSSIVYDM